jgi:hypothetical protein
MLRAGVRTACGAFNVVVVGLALEGHGVANFVWSLFSNHVVFNRLVHKQFGFRPRLSDVDGLLHGDQGKEHHGVLRGEVKRADGAS